MTSTTTSVDVPPMAFGDSDATESTARTTTTATVDEDTTAGLEDEKEEIEALSFPGENAEVARPKKSKDKKKSSSKSRKAPLPDEPDIPLRGNDDEPEIESTQLPTDGWGPRYKLVDFIVYNRSTNDGIVVLHYNGPMSPKSFPYYLDANGADSVKGQDGQEGRK
eukprot:scaffold4545_cov139-Amphora_coffeaeformis.AAC.11